MTKLALKSFSIPVKTRFIFVSTKIISFPLFLFQLNIYICENVDVRTRGCGLTTTLSYLPYNLTLLIEYATSKSLLRSLVFVSANLFLSYLISFNRVISNSCNRSAFLSGSRMFDNSCYIIV